MMRNRLKLLRIYEIGGMCRARESGKLWRDELTPWLESRGMIVINPYKKPVFDDQGIEDDDSFEQILECKNNEDWIGLSKIMKPIRNIDLRYTDTADCLFCYYDEEQKPFGTIEEISTANRAKKPIIFVNIRGGKKNAPNWVFAMLPHELIFDSIEQAKEYLVHIDEDETIDDLGRWKFLNLEADYKRVLGC